MDLLGATGGACGMVLENSPAPIFYASDETGHSLVTQRSGLVAGNAMTTISAPRRASGGQSFQTHTATDNPLFIRLDGPVNVHLLRVERAGVTPNATYYQGPAGGQTRLRHFGARKSPDIKLMQRTTALNTDGAEIIKGPFGARHGTPISVKYA